jgi:hypothetical protein
MSATTLALRGRVDGRTVSSATTLAGVLVLAFVVLRLLFATSLGGFVVASDDYVNPTGTPDPLPVTTSTGGYDGQFVYRLSVDPWTTAATEHGVTLDNPAYRQQRIGTPVLAWIVGQLPGVSVPLALILVNALALVVAAWYAARLALAAGRHPAWGLVLAFPACMPISLGRDLTEPVAWAGVLAGIWYVRARRWPAAAAAFVAAVLARETSLVIVGGLLTGEVLRLLALYWPSRRPASALRARLARPAPAPPAPAPPAPAPAPAPAGASAPEAGLATATGDDRPASRPFGWAAAGGPAWLFVPLVIGVGWQFALGQIWGSVPLRSGGSGNLNGLPFLGVFRSLFADLPGFTNVAIDTPAIGVVVFLERFALLAMFGYAAIALAKHRSQVSTGEVIAWGLAVALAISLRGWRTDVQFLRAANEAVGLSMLIALGDPARTGRWARWLGAALVFGVALEYAVRQ